MIRLIIKDFGVGFNPEGIKKKLGLGLASMEERARLAGGDFFLDSQPGQGTEIRVRVPIIRI